MDTNKNYSLFSDQIEDVVAEYVAKDATLSHSVSKPTPSQLVFRLTKGRGTGVVTFSIKRTGLVSINIQGSELLDEECTKCCDYVISKTAIPNAHKKCFTIRQSIRENFEYFKAELVDQHKYTLSVKAAGVNVNRSESMIVAEANGAKVTVTLFANDTFLMQGNDFAGHVSFPLPPMLNISKISEVAG